MTQTSRQTRPTGDQVFSLHLTNTVRPRKKQFPSIGIRGYQDWRERLFVPESRRRESVGNPGFTEKLDRAYNEERMKFNPELGRAVNGAEKKAG